MHRNSILSMYLDYANKNVAFKNMEGFEIWRPLKYGSLLMGSAVRNYTAKK